METEERMAHLRRLNQAQGDALMAIRHALLCPTGEHDYADLLLGREEADGVVKLHERVRALTEALEMVLGAWTSQEVRDRARAVLNRST